MAPDLVALPAVPIPGHEAMGPGADDHPMRTMTRRAAGLAPGGWDDQARLEVATYFDALAGEWHTRTSPHRDAVLGDALRRGGAPASDAGDVCVELGSGIGAYTAMLAGRWRRVLAVDVALEMLLRAPAAPGHRVLGDGARLPLPPRVASAFVLVNAFLFPAEVDRVLAPDGLIVWVNSSGPQTPIYLAAEEVVAALPGRWTGVHSVAGVGTWCVARRADSAV